MGSIKSKLLTKCPFPEVFCEVEPGSISSAPVYRLKIVHLRADFDGYRWWNTCWPCHRELFTPERSNEIDSVYDALIDKTSFPGLNSLRRFCNAHPEALADPTYSDEYNFYYVGEHCYYWLRLITRERDYNLYLHAFAKDSIGGGA